ncbi:MAG: ParB/RepB/Spo0J family partition protein [Planctomycetota bacterium]
MALNDNNLGKTMSKVFAKTQRRDTGSARGTLEVDLNLIIPSKANPRKTIDADRLDELVQSVTTHGILQPLVVVKRGGGFEIIAGERRYRAARKAGLAKVPVVVHEAASEEELCELRLIENIQREDLNAIELAQAYQSLIKDYGLTQEQVATRVGKNRSSITNCLRLLTLPTPLQDLVATDALSMGHARALLPLDDLQQQRALAHRIIDQGISVRETERLVRQNSSTPTTAATDSPSTRKGGKPSHIKELESNLYRLFGAPVSIRERDGKGSLTIHFETKGAFKQIVEVLDDAFRQAQRS